MDLTQKPWWSFLAPSQKEALSQSFTLLSEEAEKPPHRFHDYSFIVFPAAKAYEGFLKKFFLHLKLITPADYSSDYFRIGKSLNPSLSPKYRNGYVYDKLKHRCGSKALPQQLWQTWKKSRNRLFHFFPQHKRAISLEEAQNRLSLITSSIDAAFSLCPPPSHSSS